MYWFSVKIPKVFFYIMLKVESLCPDYENSESAKIRIGIEKFEKQIFEWTIRFPNWLLHYIPFQSSFKETIVWL